MLVVVPSATAGFRFASPAREGVASPTFQVFFAPFAWRLAGPSMKRSIETPFVGNSEFNLHLKDRGTTRRAKSLLCDVSAKAVDNLFEADAFRQQSAL
jgi:hypothetical protein